MIDLEQLNAPRTDESRDLLDGIYEHSPWIAEARARAAAVRDRSRS